MSVNLNTPTKNRKSKASKGLNALSSVSSKIHTPKTDASAGALEPEPRKRTKTEKGSGKLDPAAESTSAKLENRQSCEASSTKIAGTGLPETAVETKKKRRHKEKGGGGVSEIPLDDSTGHNGAVEEKAMIATGVEETVTTKTNKKSKRGRRERDLADGGSSEEGQKRKKRKKDEQNTRKPEEMQCDGLPNPEQDASLTDQARKALTYAYDQFNGPTTWKFNKARQNWLIRNMWSDQTIPDKHVPLLTRYLANVQGGVREKLVQACESALLPVPATTSAGPDTQVADEQARPPELTTAAVEMKQIRARAILNAVLGRPSR